MSEEHYDPAPERDRSGTFVKKIWCVDIETIPQLSTLLSKDQRVISVEWHHDAMCSYPIAMLDTKLETGIALTTDYYERVQAMPQVDAEGGRTLDIITGHLRMGEAGLFHIGCPPALHPMTCNIVQVSFGWWDVEAKLDVEDSSEQPVLAAGDPIIKTKIIQWDDKNIGGRQVDDLVREDTVGALETQTLMRALSLIEKACDNRRIIVTFNGKGFDLPMLRMRAMVRRLPTTLLFDGGRGLLYPWSHEYHCDLRLLFGSGNRYAKGTLLDWSSALGIESEEHGADVHQWVRTGRWDDLRQYGEHEMHNLCNLWTRAEVIL